MHDAKPVLQPIKKLYIFRIFLIAKGIFPACIGLELAHIPELALPRRVIHHRHDPDAIFGAKFIQLLNQSL